MKPIIQLDKILINKIAAGEVVERPLSVVKELTENAIDAGASVIAVEIRDGGLESIRVTDNGGGIPARDLPLAFARHATSKIASFDDLTRVRTLGFRGEALSSIAAVAQVEMFTKTSGENSGTRVEIHGGELLSSRDIGCANGTTLIVSNLFYNTPARRKFLKKPATEAGYISHCMERLALGNPALTLRYISNGRLVFQTNGNGDLKTTMLSIYGRDVASRVAAVSASAGEMRLDGLVGKPETARGNRQHASFFINGRYVQSRLLSKAVESAMKTMLPSGKFPLYALNLALPPELLDVNVHPNKLEVRFADEDAVYFFVEDAVRDALSEHNLIPTVRLGSRAERLEPEPEQIPLNINPPTRFRESRSRSYTPPPPDFSVREVRSVEEPKKVFTNCEIHCLIFETYWLVSQEESLFLIDQHAAHERVLYEDFLRKARDEKVGAQYLLVPIPLRLTPKERQILHENRELFALFGFEISDDIEFPAILSAPFLIKNQDASEFFTELLDKMSEVGFSRKSPYAHKTELIAMAACKAAVKAGDSLDEEQTRALVERLLSMENPFTCPHGRPTIIEITKKELERRFKRS